MLLPRGAWEQDDALLACGVVDFDPSHHMPLPPGFPLWVLTGRFVRLLGVADPLLALQVASAVLSIVGLWALVGLWDGLVGRGVSLAGAVLAAFLPGVWFHAGRALSETPAAALAIVGLALWVRGGREALVPGVAMLTCAALVRPPLAPFFALAVLLAAWASRHERARLLRAAGAALAIVAVVLAPAVVEAGGLKLFWSAASTHGGEHLGLLGTQGWNLASIGFVRGLAWPGAAAVFTALAAVGWLALRRRLGWAFLAGTIAGGWLLYLVLFLHNRTYPRYWVLVWLLMATPAVEGVRRILRSDRIAMVVSCLAAALSAVWVWPAVSHVHRQALPVVAALDEVGREGRGTLAFEDQLFSFRNLAARQGRLKIGSLRVSEIPPRRLTVGANPLWFLTEGEGKDIPSNASVAMSFACAEPRVWRLSQERFLRVRLVRNPVLAWRGASVPETDSLRRFIWCEGDSLILLPALRGGGTLALGCEIQPLLGRVEVVAKVAGQETWREVRPATRQVFRIPIPPLPERNRLTQIVPVNLLVEKEVRLPGDLRKLAVRIFTASVEAPPHRPLAYAFFPEEDSLIGALVEARGTYAPELLGEPPRPSAWTGTTATFALPIGEGTIGVEMLAPRPMPAVVQLRLGSVQKTVEVRREQVGVTIVVPEELADAGHALLEVTSSPPYVPGGGDSRVLGVAISRIWFVPDS